ncbi:MAG: DOPA 4,5-dioxygenase family protein [Methylophilus sp.]|nr:DOPA 4,5-dioxygenase family protein [Methylophilus sp.]
MHPFHAHIYFTLDEQALASRVREHIAQAIPQLTYVGKLISMPIGPHPKPMFEIHIPINDIEPAIMAIDHLREGLSVLIHPVQHDELEAHTTQARWLGTPLALKLDVLQQS